MVAVAVGVEAVVDLGVEEEEDAADFQIEVVVDVVVVFRAEVQEVGDEEREEEAEEVGAAPLVDVERGVDWELKVVLPK